MGDHAPAVVPYPTESTPSGVESPVNKVERPDAQTSPSLSGFDGSAINVEPSLSDEKVGPPPSVKTPWSTPWTKELNDAIFDPVVGGAKRRPVVYKPSAPDATILPESYEDRAPHSPRTDGTSLLKLTAMQQHQAALMDKLANQLSRMQDELHESRREHNSTLSQVNDLSNAVAAMVQLQDQQRQDMHKTLGLLERQQKDAQQNLGQSLGVSIAQALQEPINKIVDSVDQLIRSPKVTISTPRASTQQQGIAPVVQPAPPVSVATVAQQSLLTPQAAAAQPSSVNVPDTITRINKVVEQKAPGSLYQPQLTGIQTLHNVPLPQQGTNQLDQTYSSAPAPINVGPTQYAQASIPTPTRLNFGRNSTEREGVGLSDSAKFNQGVQEILNQMMREGDGWMPNQPAPSGGAAPPTNVSQRETTPASSASMAMPNTSIWKRKFDGVEPDLESYLSQFQAVGDACGWTDYVRGAVLVASLEKDAVRVMDHLPKGPVSAKDVAAKLREMFAPEASVVSYRTQFESRTRESSETAQQFALALSNLAAKAYPTKSATDRDELVLHKFLSGQPYNVRFAVGAVPFTSLAHAVAGVLRFEALVSKSTDAQPRAVRTNMASRQPQQRRPPVNRRRATASAAIQLPMELMGEVPYVSATDVDIDATSDSSGSAEPYDAIMDRLDDLATEVSAIRRGSNIVCWYCQKPGHYTDRCSAMLKRLQDGGYTGQALPRISWNAPRTPPRGDSKAVASKEPEGSLNTK